MNTDRNSNKNSSGNNKIMVISTPTRRTAARRADARNLEILSTRDINVTNQYTSTTKGDSTPKMRSVKRNAIETTSSKKITKVKSVQDSDSEIENNGIEDSTDDILVNDRENDDEFSTESVEKTSSDDSTVTKRPKRERKVKKSYEHPISKPLLTMTSLNKSDLPKKSLGYSHVRSSNLLAICGQPSFLSRKVKRIQNHGSDSEDGCDYEVYTDDEDDDDPNLTDDPFRPYIGVPRVTSGKSDTITLAKPFRLPQFTGKRPNIFGGLRAGTTLGTKPRNNVNRGPIHDPDEENAIVLYTPPPISEEQKMRAYAAHGSKPEGSELPPVHVVVDPVLGNILRPHQIDGVRFMYDCVTGVVQDNIYGCIMADEMGLGKTLQCITLLWTLLRQSPQPGKPTIEKAVIACPSSLVKNWANELVKWLGIGRIRPFACDNKGTKADTTRDMRKFVTDKGRSIVQPVLIVSYETLRTYTEILKQTDIGLLMCDEGHRLKNADSLTYKALNSLKAKRRVILSGTPIQNDLSEYFALLNFATPTVLGTGSEFRKNFEIPILKGRDSCATDKEREVSNVKLQELQEVANKFIIRRTAELLTKYLPVKYEHIIFVELSEFQKKIYKQYVGSKEVEKAIRDSDNSDSGKFKGQVSLKAITALKKLCNHPALLDVKNLEDKNIKALFPSDFDRVCFSPEYSGKFSLLLSMLAKIKSETDDKIVLISNYTQTLDLIERMCTSYKWGSLRLDGSMNIRKRQKIVDTFNNPESPEFIFLLSSKAGGCGINLVGANRLILLDPDWNPANDAQAMARVWRDGQLKTCYLYRFIATGSIEEKIFQRQAHKQSLSSCVVDEEEDVERHFSLNDLRELFIFKDDTQSDTHDTFKCKRCINGKQIKAPPEGETVINTGATAADTSAWNHFSKRELNKCNDMILRTESQHTGAVSYVFQNKSHDRQMPKLK